MDKIEELLTRGVGNIIPDKKKLEILLRSGKKLNIYLGIDPTATKIHLGHAVPLRKLQKFSECGHNVTFLIGDFTALIGDTSDKDSERPSLTYEEIQNNFKTYKKQAEKILDFSKINVKFNSEWLNKLTFPDIVKLCQHFSAGDFVGRELIKKRLNEGKKVGLHELLYPVMQGYDSYFMDTDIQLGGTDQTFNMQAGRTLQDDLRKKDSFIIANGFLTGTDRRKMSKTWGNAIWLEDSPEDMFGKVMSIKDELIIEYFTLGTNLEMEKIKEIENRLKQGENPMNLKKELALIIIAELHSKEKALLASENFEKTVQNKEIPENTPEIIISDKISIIDLLVGQKFCSSNSEAKRLLEQGGVEEDGKKVTDPNWAVCGNILKIGKRKFVRLVKSKK